jgi:hypothetical protein
MRTVLFWAITQCVVVIPYRHFGINYCSHLQEKIGLIGCPEMSVNNYHYMLCNTPEE